MGISGVTEKLVNSELARQKGVRVVRRFTGGGTVVVDEGTLFTSFICNKADVDGAPQYPRELMRWSADFYAPVFDSLVHPAYAGTFRLNEHDYCLSDRKFGGNAQTISRDRWVHHTSFLWAFKREHMALLKIPEKRPDYRRDRPHGEFLTALSDNVPPGTVPEAFHDTVAARLRESFDVCEVDPQAAWDIVAASNERASNVYVDY